MPTSVMKDVEVTTLAMDVTNNLMEREGGGGREMTIKTLEDGLREKLVNTLLELVSLNKVQNWPL